MTRILRDLETEGYIRTQREGRLNLFGIDNQAPLRRQEARDVAVDELLRVLQNDG